MTSQVPFKPLTPEALARLTPDEQAAFTRALLCVAEDRIPPHSVLADLVEMVQRLITEDAASPRAAGLETRLMAAVDWFERDLGFVAPELIPLRIEHLRGLLLGAVAADDE